GRVDLNHAHELLRIEIDLDLDALREVRGRAELHIETARVIDGVAIDAAEREVRLSWRGQNEAAPLDDEVERLQVYCPVPSSVDQDCAQIGDGEGARRTTGRRAGRERDGDIGRDQRYAAEPHIAPQQRQQRGGESQRFHLALRAAGDVERRALDADRG